MNEAATLTVTGMKCGGCEANVKTALGSLSGVTSVSASSKDKIVSVEFDNEKTSLQTIAAKINQLGYSVADDS